MDLDFINPDPEIGDFGWAQRRFVDEVENQYNAGKPVRIITLKARQLGISTVTEAILFWWTFIHPGTNGLVMTHEATQSQELFNITKLYWEHWPYQDAYTLKYGTKQHMQWLETRSQLRVATAKNLGTGRGSTVHAVHASEASRYIDPKTLFTGLDNSIPSKHGSIVVIESTANGVGNWFYDQWQRAEAHETDYIPLFFPWYEHPEYRMRTTLSVPLELDADEKELLRIGASYEAIAWRRWAIPNKAAGSLDEFHQEYPSTPEEAFITSGNPIFSTHYLNECIEREDGTRGILIDEPNGTVKFVPDPDGLLTVYRAPKKGDRRWDRYMVSADPSETLGGDPGCIQVINRQTFEQVAVWHGQTNPYLIAEEMIRVGKYYNWAMLVPEVDYAGHGTIAYLLAKSYPHIWQHKNADRIAIGKASFGWWSNANRKAWAIGQLQKLIVDQSITLHDRQTFLELRNYVQRPDGSMGNANPDTHDDSVMAFAICCVASITEGPFMADTGAPNPIVDIYNQQFDEAIA